MKMSDVKFNVEETKGSENINPTMTFIGRESIAAIHHMGHTYDNLVEALGMLIDSIESNSGNEPSLSLYQRSLDEAKEALKQAKGEE